MLFKSDALLVLLGVGIGSAAIIGTSSTTSTACNGVSGLGLGLSVVEAFSPLYSGVHVCSNRFAASYCRSGSWSSAALYAEDASSTSSAADSAGDATDDDGQGGGISVEAGGQLTKKSDQSSTPAAGDNSAKTALEYRPLQRQWWEVCSSFIFAYYARVLSMFNVMLCSYTTCTSNHNAFMGHVDYFYFISAAKAFAELAMPKLAWQIDVTLPLTLSSHVAHLSDQSDCINIY